MRPVIYLAFGAILAVGAFGQTDGKRAEERELPVYPNAKVMDDHPDGRSTLALKSLHGYSSGASYSSSDSPKQVLDFYRGRLKELGQVVECHNGTNKKVDLQVDEKVTAHPGNCYPESFAAGGTLLKAVKGATQAIVVVLPQGEGSEIALFTVRPEMY
jgi:hypothetical protein